MMEDKEVLQKAIEIAVENEEAFNNCLEVVDRIHYPTIKYKTGKNNRIIEVNYETIIFSHDFAKAFWGEVRVIEGNLIFKQPTERDYDGSKNEKYYADEIGMTAQPVVPRNWRQHLQQMVIEENPIDYLRKFVNTETSKTIQSVKEPEISDELRSKHMESLRKTGQLYSSDQTIDETSALERNLEDDTINFGLNSSEDSDD